MPRRDHPVELTPDDEQGNFEVAEAIDEDQVLTAPVNAPGNGLHRVVSAWRIASSVHVVDAAFEDEPPILEK